ncbi:MAG: hypothetical protein KDA28_12255, partial [Phycisphaerales bacterium]|nr:hypothetical protein [Phycisphaerales bacterium]
MERLIGIGGVLVLLGLAWLLSERRRDVPIRLVVSGIVLQFVIAVVLLQVPVVVSVFRWIAEVINGVIRQADAGIIFIFGPELGSP